MMFLFSASPFGGFASTLGQPQATGFGTAATAQTASPFRATQTGLNKIGGGGTTAKTTFTFGSSRLNTVTKGFDIDTPIEKVKALTFNIFYS